jgi:hypothetical protein
MSWDIAELDRQVGEYRAAAGERDELRAAITFAPRPPRRLRPAPPRPDVPPMPMTAAEPPAVGWLREIRLAQKAGLLTRREARSWLNLPPRRWWWRG